MPAVLQLLTQNPPRSNQNTNLNGNHKKAAKAGSSFWLPIIFGSRCNPPTSDARPMFTSANWKAASSVQKRMSQADTNSSPAPKTAPCIQAITAFPQISWCSGNGTSLKCIEMQENSPLGGPSLTFSHCVLTEKLSKNPPKIVEKSAKPPSFDRCECILPCLSKIADLQSPSCHILCLGGLPWLAVSPDAWGNGETTRFFFTKLQNHWRWSRQLVSPSQHKRDDQLLKKSNSAYFPGFSTKTGLSLQIWKALICSCSFIFKTVILSQYI